MRLLSWALIVAGIGQFLYVATQHKLVTTDTAFLAMIILVAAGVLGLQYQYHCHNCGMCGPPCNCDHCGGCRHGPCCGQCDCAPLPGEKA